MVKPVKINKYGNANVEITMDSLVYESASSLLLLEDLRDTMGILGYGYENHIIGEGFEIFLELGIAHIIKNRKTLKNDLEEAKLTILEAYPQIAKLKTEIIKNQKSSIDGRPSKSDRDKIRIVTEVIGELSVEYGGRTPKNILITEMSNRYNVDEEKTEEILRILKRKGIIFEPQQGYLKIC